MAITITSGDSEKSVFGNKRIVMGTLALDSAYPTGGYPLAPSKLGGMRYIDRMDINDAQGFTFEYDYINQKLKVFNDAPAIIVEEKNTSVAGVFSLKYPCAWVISCSVPGTTGGYDLVGSGAVLAAGQLQYAAAPAYGKVSSFKTYGAADVTYTT